LEDKGEIHTLNNPIKMFEMSSIFPIDAMETKEEHENSLDGTALVDGNQLVEI
jgi:hypothetical protein